jgi:type I restriction enzyme S subunit
MKSNYKLLGKYIQPVDERNSGLEDLPLMGLSVSKVFFPTIANLVGTDMKTYKIVYRNQFTYIADTSRRGDKIAISLNEKFDKMLVSQAYTPFEVKDNNELNPEYLMMWFRRPEFDRYARFKSHGSAREIFDWEEMCNTLLPIPHITKQREIVKEYNIIQNRIALNQQLIQKLEETAQAIYREWFMEFEFPDENGKPYKSNGGEMVWNEELQKEIPLGWEVEKLGNIIESYSKTHSFKKDKLIFFNTSDILDGEFLHNDYMSIYEMPGQAKKQIKKGDILFSEIRPNNKRYSIVRIEANDYIVSTKLMVLRKKIETFTTHRLYQFLTEESFITELQQSADGRSGTFPQITFEEDLQQKPFLIADKRIEQLWNKFLNCSYDIIFSKKDENKKLIEMKNLLLSKLATIA